MTPTMEELARLKPNAKGNLVLDRKEMRTIFVYHARLGKHMVRLDEESPEHYPDEDSALAAAVEFRRRIREALKNQQAQV